MAAEGGAVGNLSSESNQIAAGCEYNFYIDQYNL